MRAIDHPLELKDGHEVMADLRAAARRLAGVAQVTPVFTSSTLDERVGGEVLLKCENFQYVGAFKFRGAYNAISQLSEQQRAAGVLTYSSGNHAQAVARVGQMMGIDVVVVKRYNRPPFHTWTLPRVTLRRCSHSVLLRCFHPSDGAVTTARAGSAEDWLVVAESSFAAAAAAAVVWIP